MFVFYTCEEDSAISNPILVPVSNLDTTSVMVPDLVAGFEYTFNITSKNSNGSPSILCQPISYIIGESVRLDGY